MKKKINIVCGTLFLFTICMGLFIFCKQQQEYIIYLMNREKCMKVDAIVEEILISETDNSKRVSILSYKQEGILVELKFAKDIRDAVGETIELAILPSGKIVRTAMTFSEDVFSYIPYLCLFMVGVACLIRMGKEKHINYVEEKEIKIADPSWERVMDRRFRGTANILSLTIECIAIIVGIVLLLVSEWLWDMGVLP